MSDGTPEWETMLNNQPMEVGGMRTLHSHVREEIDRLRTALAEAARDQDALCEAVKAAYFEGFSEGEHSSDARHNLWDSWTANEAWLDSGARLKQLLAAPPQPEQEPDQ